MAKKTKSLFGKFWQSLGFDIDPNTRTLTTRRSARPWLELLEDRCVPANFGTVQGTVFLDSNNNGFLDARDARLPGVKVTLIGTSTSPSVMLGNGSIKVTATTNAQGTYKFTNLPQGIDALAPYTYKLVTSAVPGLVNGAAQTFTGVSVTSNGQVIKHDFRFKTGLTSSALSMRQFMTTTTPANFPYGPAGAGAAIVNQAPTALPIPDVTIDTGAADKPLDLAGFFRDANFTNSEVLFDIQNGPVANQKIKLTLFDAQAPMNVTNFLNYALGTYTASEAGSASYNNSIFHRMTTVGQDGFGVLQGGGFALANANGTDLQNVRVNPLGAFFDGTKEFSAANKNLKGTIATAQSADHSVTTQFYFNTQDNPEFDKTSPTDTNFYTVFGKVADTASLNVLKSLTNATPTNVTASPDPIADSFGAMPMYNYDEADAAGFPGNATKDNYVTINSVTLTKREEFLTYALDGGNTNNPGDTPNVATATLTNEFVMIHAIAAGTTTFNVTVTDRYGATVTQKFKVKVNGNDAPDVDLNGSGTGGKDVTVNYPAAGAGTEIAPNAVLTDPDNTTLSQLTAVLTSRPDGVGETIGLNTAATTAASGAGLSVTLTPDITDPTNGPLTLTVGNSTASANLSVFQTILQGIVYANADDTPTATDRTIKVTVTDTAFPKATSLERTSTIKIVPATVSVAVTGSPANEGSGLLTYTFTRIGDKTDALTVTFSVAGTAISGVDFTSPGTTVIIPAGELSATVTVTPINDRLLEADETVILTVVQDTGYAVVSPSSATGTIDDDESATLDIALATNVTEAGGAQNIPVTLTIIGNGTGLVALGTGVTLAAEVTDNKTGTAPSSDYTFTTQTVTFSPSDETATVKNVTITPLPNPDPTGNSTVDLTLGPLTKPLSVDAVLGQVENTTTIVDDD